MAPTSSSCIKKNKRERESWKYWINHTNWGKCLSLEATLFCLARVMPVDRSKPGFSTSRVCPHLSVLSNRHLLNGGNCFVVTANRSENRRLSLLARGKEGTPRWLSSQAAGWVSPELQFSGPHDSRLTGAAWALAGWAPRQS